MIDPLLPPGTRPSPSGARPAPHRRALRLAGAAGMGSLLMLTGYVTAGAQRNATTGTDATDDAAAATAAAATASTTTAAASTTAPAVVTADTVAATTSTIAVCTNTYTVVPGDSWTGIADNASVVAGVLYALNGTSAETMLHPGDVVCLPDGVTVVVTTTEAPATTAAPAPTPAPATTAAPVVTAAPAAPAAQPASSSKGS